jgi:hypothetical protein
LFGNARQERRESCDYLSLMKTALKDSPIVPLETARATEKPLHEKPTVPPRPPVRPQQGKVEREKLTRKYRKLSVHPLPERRKTNKFRESHSGDAT